MTTLPESNSSHPKMDGWKTILSYWEGDFSGTMWNFRWAITLISLPFFFIYLCFIQDGKRRVVGCWLLLVGDKKARHQVPPLALVLGLLATGPHLWQTWVHYSSNFRSLDSSKSAGIQARNWSHSWLDNSPWMACGLRKCSLFCGWWNTLFPLVVQVLELILKARGSCEREALSEWHENCSSFRYLHSPIKARISQDQWLFLVPLMDGRYHIIPQLAVYTTYIPLIDKIKVTVYSL